MSNHMHMHRDKIEENLFGVFLALYENVWLFNATKTILSQFQSFVAISWPFLEKPTFSNVNVEEKIFLSAISVHMRQNLSHMLIRSQHLIIICIFHIWPFFCHYGYFGHFHYFGCNGCPPIENSFPPMSDQI